MNPRSSRVVIRSVFFTMFFPYYIRLRNLPTWAEPPWSEIEPAGREVACGGFFFFFFPRPPPPPKISYLLSAGLSLKLVSPPYMMVRLAFLRTGALFQARRTFVRPYPRRYFRFRQPAFFYKPYYCVRGFLAERGFISLATFSAVMARPIPVRHKGRDSWTAGVLSAVFRVKKLVFIGFFLQFSFKCLSEKIYF